MKEKLFSYISFYQWWKSIDKPILSLILLLFLVGLFFSLVSTSLIASDKLDTNTYFFFFKHTVFVFFGFFLIFFLSFIPEKEIFRISVIFLCFNQRFQLLINKKGRGTRATVSQRISVSQRSMSQRSCKKPKQKSFYSS